LGRRKERQYRRQSTRRGLRVRRAEVRHRRQRPVGAVRPRHLPACRPALAPPLPAARELRRSQVQDGMPHLTRVLVANRGEIALRIIRACQEEGVESVAVYSDADRLSPHVRAANRAVALGAARAAESYLNIPKLIAAARDTGCQAIHPGYGFLSERAPFAAAVRDAGLTFVGPSPEAIKAMGDKTEARRRMKQAGVPIVPGLTSPLQDAPEAAREA